MKNGLIIGTIACMVAVILVGSVLAPVINTTTTTTIKVDNDGAVGLRMEKITTGNFTITFDEVDGEFTATNGSDAQIIDDVCIFYADNNVAVWLDDSSVRMVGVDADDKIFNAALSDSAAITITKSSEGVNITDGTVDKTFPVPSWSFVPKSTGAYGFFLNETEVNTAGMDTLFVGSFAGVDCYNGINTYDLPIVLDKTASGSTLSGAKWIRAAAEPEELNPDDLHIIPLGPSINPVDPEPDTTIMAVATPTYTDGEWGYDVETIDGVQKAILVSYSGSGGNIVTPSYIGGYEVAEIGKRDTSAQMMDNASIAANSTLTITPGPTKINASVFRQITNLTGSLTIPETITFIDTYAFYRCTGFNGDFKILSPSITITASAFSRCYFTGSVVLPTDTTINNGGFVDSRLSSIISLMDTGSIGATALNNNSSVKQILNLGSYEWTTTTGGLAADEVRDNVPALGYLAVAQYNETAHEDGPMAAMFAVIPLIMVIAILMFAVGFAIYRRME